MEKTKCVPFFLFPGLACTERLFEPQKEGLAPVCRVCVPAWTEPAAGECLRDFARRWGEAVWRAYYSPEVPESERLDPAAGCFVGGLSFGGMCAPFAGEVLEEHGVRVFACFGLATIQDGTQLPRSSRFLWRTVNFLPCGGWGLLKVLCGASLKCFSRRFSMPRRETYLQLLESPCRRSHRVLRMIVGTSAKNEGRARDQRRRWVYLVFGLLLGIFSLSSLVSDITRFDENFSGILDGVITVVIDVTSIIMVVEMFVAGVKVKLLKKKISETKTEEIAA